MPTHATCPPDIIVSQNIKGGKPVQNTLGMLASGPLSLSLSDLMDPVKLIDEIEARIGHEDLITGLCWDDDLCFFIVE
ncbi:hypothetical protein FoTM2_007934 [Fusarium oxysporum f. sp. vasinfectum]|nr:hypothetical protein FoTM2_007934 [Fusarium oxysporum f. sp. vasinfectum]